MIRRATHHDLTLVRELRLAALADAPRDFDSTHEVEAKWSAEEWANWVDRGPLFLAGSGEVASGLAAALRDPQEPTTAYLGALWVAPMDRGAGVGDLLVDAVVGWARSSGAAALHLHVIHHNVHAQALYRRHGFHHTGAEIVGAHGDREVELIHPLDYSEPA